MISREWNIPIEINGVKTTHFASATVFGIG